MKQRYNVHELKTHFSKVLDLIISGRTIVVCKAGKPVAKLSPFAEAEQPIRKPGSARGLITMKGNIEAPLNDAELSELGIG